MIEPQNVHDTLRRHQLTDGFSLVLDLERSEGAWLVDASTGERHLDCFTGFASWPLGYNHPMMNDPEFSREIALAARNNPANSDLYTSLMASFVDAFAGRVTPPEFRYHFWISGGALAVENAMKVAFDWKARKLGRTDMHENVDDLVILHFRQAFHGRSGYTMSVTNTLPDKVGLFPRFSHWPRVHNPTLELDLAGGVANDIEAEEARAATEIEAAFRTHGKRVAGILIEPMQGEGGDNHFRSQFLQKLRDYADQHEALLLFDEVQTGFFGSGKPWLWQHLGVVPDVVAFGKKTQVCGIYAGPRIDEVKDHVFKRSSRINSTWGGSLTDMVRCRRFIEIIEAENLTVNIHARGEQLIAGLRQIASEFGSASNVRGIGSLVAFTLPDRQSRERTVRACFANKLLILPCGERSIRFRLPFVITRQGIDEALGRMRAALVDAGLEDGVAVAASGAEYDGL